MPLRVETMKTVNLKRSTSHRVATILILKRQAINLLNKAEDTEQ